METHRDQELKETLVISWSNSFISLTTEMKTPKIKLGKEPELKHHDSTTR